MKHVKLFENFMEGEEQRMIIAAVGEGATVGCVPTSLAMEVKKHLLNDDYYKIYLTPADGSKKWFIVDADNFYKDSISELGFFADEAQFEEWVNANPGCTILYPDGTVNEDATSISQYALPVPSGDGTAYIESYGAHLQDTGATEHFKEYLEN
jgi:hypothetical protein